MAESTGPRPINAPGSDTLDAIVREWARVKIQKLDILNYNGANLAFNHAAHTANLLGLSETQKIGVTPFPCPTNITMQQTPHQLPPEETEEAEPAPAPGKIVSLLQSPAGQLFGRALGYGLPAAGLLYAGSWLASKPAVVQPPAVVKPADGKEGRVGLEVEGWQK